MSSFFSVPGSHANKRKRTASGSAPDSSKKSRNYSADKPQRSRKRNEDDEISSDSENEGPRRPVDSEEEGSEDELAGETAQERRLRLAQQYLDNIREEVGMMRLEKLLEWSRLMRWFQMMEVLTPKRSTAILSQSVFRAMWYVRGAFYQL